MKKCILLIVLLNVMLLADAFGQYNSLWIPDTISGTTFNLNIKDTFKQILPGNQTITGGINGNFWLTLIFRKGDTVHMNVHSYLNDSTTLHWHGMHLPAVMDGGPHQVIPPGTIWQPYWLVKNNAATYWYHPHLHHMTTSQIMSGLGGFIIVRDVAESALALPRTYGVDDIPLALTSRSCDTANSFTCSTSVYGDYMLTNGTMNAEVSLPKQYVRLRVLNAELVRAYNLGFSDNRTFYVIGNDGGLLDTPVAVTRVILAIGERVEILVNLGNDPVGSSLDLKAFNSGQPAGFPGGEPITHGAGGSLLNNADFPVLHINVSATAAGAITHLPATLVHNDYLTSADANVSRVLNITWDPNSGFGYDSTLFDLGTINKTVYLNSIEQWTVNNTNVSAHTFHIHGVQFKILSRSSGPVAAYESGWKDTYYLPTNESVTFVTKFEDYADNLHPFMYHCHFIPHEDGSMMGQFVVSDITAVQDPGSEAADFSLFPNPANDRIFVSFSDPSAQAYYVRITNAVGRTLYMLPRPQLANGIDISHFRPGTYFLQLTDDRTKKTITRKFIKE